MACQAGVDGNYGKHGCFEVLHCFPSAKALADALRQRTGQTYGAPFRAFLERLADELEQHQRTIRAEVTRFTHESDLHKAYTGDRIHMEPSLTIPLAKAPGYGLETQFKLMYTHYQQDVPADMDPYYYQQGFGNLSSTVNRTLPSARLRGGHAHRLRLSVDIHDGIFDIPHRQA